MFEELFSFTVTKLPPKDVKSMDPYGPDMWNGNRISDLQTSHLSNIIDMLKKRSKDCSEERLAGRMDKISEIQAEINKRRDAGERIIHSKHKLVLTREMLLELAHANGVPKGKGEIYIVLSGDRVFKMRGDQVQVRYDTQKTICKPSSRSQTLKRRRKS